MKEDLLQLLDKWGATNDDLTAQIAKFQDPTTKDLVRAVQCQGRKMAMQQCILDLYALLKNY